MKPVTDILFYRNAATGAKVAKLFPGQLYVATEHENIITVLGSCIATCIYDSVRGIGGMNHFMIPKELDSLPNTIDSPTNSRENRIGEFAMPNLIKALVAKGAHTADLKAKVFGGAKVLDISSDVGMKNIDFVTAYLNQHGLELAASDLGGHLPRKIIMQPTTGVVHVHRLRNPYFEHVASRERTNLRQLGSDLTPQGVG